MSSLKFNAIVEDVVKSVPLDGDFLTEHLHNFIADIAQDDTTEVVAFMRYKIRDAFKDWILTRSSRPAQILFLRNFGGDDAIERAMNQPIYQVPYDAARVAGREALLRQETSLLPGVPREISLRIGDVLPKKSTASATQTRRGGSKRT